MPDWVPDFLHGISLWDAALWLGAIIAVEEFIRRKGWRWLIGFARAVLATAEVIDNVKELPQFIKESREDNAEIKARIAEIHHETHFNNGSSTKDGVIRSENRLKRIEARLGIPEDDDAIAAVPPEQENP